MPDYISMQSIEELKIELSDAIDGLGRTTEESRLAETQARVCQLTRALCWSILRLGIDTVGMPAVSEAIQMLRLAAERMPPSEYRENVRERLEDLNRLVMRSLRPRVPLGTSSKIEIISFSRAPGFSSVLGFDYPK